MKLRERKNYVLCFGLKTAAVAQRSEEFSPSMTVVLDFHVCARKRSITRDICPRLMETFLPFWSQRQHFVVIFENRCDSMLFACEMVVEYRHAIASRTSYRLHFEFGISRNHGRNGVRAESRRSVFVQYAGIVVCGDQTRFEIPIDDKRQALRFFARFPFHDAIV
jgi:hypothetical protein